MEKRKFTLMELLVVISVIAILASLLFPALNASKGTAKRIACSGNMSQLSQLMQMYTVDFNGLLPQVLSADYSRRWPDIIMDAGYIQHESYVPAQNWRCVFSCPAMPSPPSDYRFLTHYGMNVCIADYSAPPPFVGTSLRVDKVRIPSALILATDSRQCDVAGGLNSNAVGYFRIDWSLQYSIWYGYPDPRHSKAVNVLWVDGHISPQPTLANPYLAFPFNAYDSFVYIAQ